MHRTITGRPRARLWLLAAVGLALAGCGRGDGLTRHRIKGTVTFAGKPVAFGAIFFEPTASVGKVAPTVYLPIRDGKYDTLDKGPVAGRYRVIVGGMDQSKQRVDNDGITVTPQLFQDYKFEVDFPPPNGLLDVNVPASQAIRPR